MNESEKSLDEFVAGLDTVAEQRRERRAEMWLFFRGTMILLFVLFVVLVRSLLL